MSRYSKAVDAVVRRSKSGPESGPDLNRAGHSRGHPLQLEEDLVVAVRGGAGIREGA